MAAQPRCEPIEPLSPRSRTDSGCLARQAKTWGIDRASQPWRVGDVTGLEGPGRDDRQRESLGGLGSSPVHREGMAFVMTHDGFARQSTGGRHGPRTPKP